MNVNLRDFDSCALMMWSLYYLVWSTVVIYRLRTLVKLHTCILFNSSIWPHMHTTHANTCTHALIIINCFDFIYSLIFVLWFVFDHFFFRECVFSKRIWFGELIFCFVHSVQHMWQLKSSLEERKNECTN